MVLAVKPDKAKNGRMVDFYSIPTESDSTDGVITKNPDDDRPYLKRAQCCGPPGTTKGATFPKNSPTKIDYTYVTVIYTVQRQ